MTDTYNIMAIDPGHSTGWAVGEVTGGACTLKSHGWDAWKPFVLGFHARMVDDPFRVVVYESWLLRANKAKELIGSDMQSSQCIGAIRLSCWLAQRNGAKVDLVTQHPEDKTPANAWIKAMNLHLPASDVEHNRDAIRHLYYYCVKNKIEVIP